jgi:hypothetical protein
MTSQYITIFITHLSTHTNRFEQWRTLKFAMKRGEGVKKNNVLQKLPIYNYIFFQ